MARVLSRLGGALLLAGCAVDARTTPPGPSPGPSPSPDVSPGLPVRTVCADHATPSPMPIPAGASLAVLATAERELTLFLIEDLTGCWVRLDPSQAPITTTALAVHPSGRFVFASGEVAPGRIGVAAYAIVPERAALDGLGASWMDLQTDDFPGSLIATDRGVYMLSAGHHTGYHGGMWRWSFDEADGGLTWRGKAYDRARDPFFLVHGLDDRIVYLGTETADDRGFGRVALAMAVGPGGALAPLSETGIDAPAEGVADPSGTFFWLATGWSSGTTRLDAYRPAGNGGLGRPES